MVRPGVIVFLAIIILGGVGVYLLQKPSKPPAGFAPAPTSSSEPAPAVAPSVPPSPSRIAMQAPRVDELAQVPSNPMASAIGSAEITPEKEIALVLELFQIYRREFDAFPAGQSNSQFMNALRGANPGKLPIFPLEHPRLDPAGNLLDRWRRPYQFHPVSRDRLEIRSSGPDREIFTADDLVMPNPEQR